MPKAQCSWSRKRKAALVGPRSIKTSQILAILLAATALAAGGCSKKQPAAATPQGAASQTQPAPASPDTAASAPIVQPPVVVPAPVAAAPSGGADLKELNHAYLHWVVQNRRHAKTVEEFVAASGISVPPAPAGKKYIIDGRGFIALVNQ